jgi:hypothetical protein
VIANENSSIIHLVIGAGDNIDLIYPLWARYQLQHGNSIATHCYGNYASSNQLYNRFKAFNKFYNGLHIHDVKFPLTQMEKSSTSRNLAINNRVVEIIEEYTKRNQIVVITYQGVVHPGLVYMRDKVNSPLFYIIVHGNDNQAVYFNHAIHFRDTFNDLSQESLGFDLSTYDKLFPSFTVFQNEQRTGPHNFDSLNETRPFPFTWDDDNTRLKPECIKTSEVSDHAYMTSMDDLYSTIWWACEQDLEANVVTKVQQLLDKRQFGGLIIEAVDEFMCVDHVHKLESPININIKYNDPDWRKLSDTLDEHLLQRCHDSHTPAECTMDDAYTQNIIDNPVTDDPIDNITLVDRVREQKVKTDSYVRDSDSEYNDNDYVDSLPVDTDREESDSDEDKFDPSASYFQRLWTHSRKADDDDSGTQMDKVIQISDDDDSGTQMDEVIQITDDDDSGSEMDDDDDTERSLIDRTVYVYDYNKFGIFNSTP